jgi:ElaB/YqjD/DUF883 family membrane-anchored ribosome-binding protein
MRRGRPAPGLAAAAAACAVVALLAVPGCERAKDAAREKYYNALEKVGLERREVLVKRVDNAKEAQQEAQEQFRDALEEFQALVGADGGDLEARYEKLRGEYEDAAKRAGAVHDKIRSVRNVADSLFREWEAEIGQYTDENLARESRRQKQETVGRYDQLLASMERAAAKMDPVLAKFHDQVLFLKHNLNAKVLGSLKGTAATLQGDVDRLIEDMQRSIQEADAFIRDMGKKE